MGTAVTDRCQREAASDVDEARSRAQAFLDAIVWGRHTELWELLGRNGRDTVLRVALGNGLDRVVAGRLRDGSANPVDRDAFLGQLLEGLRRDLRSVELDVLTLADDVEWVGDDEVRIELVVPSTIPGTGSWSGGHLVLAPEDERGWRVDRVEPRLSGP